jgi:hypothetical protein
MKTRYLVKSMGSFLFNFNLLITLFFRRHEEEQCVTMDVCILPSGIAENIYLIISRGQPTKGGPPAWRLDEGLISPHRKRPACYNMLGD